MRHTSLVGVDISGSSIKVVQIDNKNNITAYGKTILPAGVVEDGLVVDKEQFALKLNEVLKKTKPQVLFTEGSSLRSVLCLPESKLFTHHLVLPAGIKKSEIENFIRDNSQIIIPFKLEDLYWDYHVAEEDGRENATFVGAKKADLDNYVEAFTSANLRPEFVCGELFALGYALLPQTTLAEDYVIVDIGAHSTTIGLFAIDAIANASIKVPIGGDLLTQKISEKLGISLRDAEKQKKEYGLNLEYEETGVPAVLRESVSDIIDKIKEARAFFETKTGNQIMHIVLAGGTSLLPGINSFMSEQLGVEVKSANPLERVNNKKVFNTKTSKVFFSNSIGLAFYGNSTDRTRINLLTQYRYQDGDANVQIFRISDMRSVEDFKYVLYRLIQKTRNLLSLLTNRFSVLSKINLKLLLSIICFVATIGFLVWVVAEYT